MHKLIQRATDSRLVRGAERTRGPTRWSLLVRGCSVKQNRMGCPLLQAHAALPSEQRSASEEAHISLDSAWLLSACTRRPSNYNGGQHESYSANAANKLSADLAGFSRGWKSAREKRCIEEARVPEAFRDVFIDGSRPNLPWTIRAAPGRQTGLNTELQLERTTSKTEYHRHGELLIWKDVSFIWGFFFFFFPCLLLI